jgi:hypothetical protein
MKQLSNCGIVLLFGALLLSPLSIWAQEQVSGTVTDENGAPLPGATVLVEETNQGTTTDFDGNYQINAAQGQTLVFSYVGYTTQMLEISSGTLDLPVPKRYTYPQSEQTINGENVKAANGGNDTQQTSIFWDTQ